MENLNSFKLFTDTLEEISKTKKRLEIQQILYKYYSKLTKSPDLLISVLYLSTASFYPEHFNKELGVGETIIQKMVCEITGKKLKTIRDEMRQTGDLGVIAMKYKTTPLFKSEKELTISEIIKNLREISEEQGIKSVNSKMNKMLKLIIRSKGTETKYLIRLFEGKLKIGLALKTVLISLALTCQKNNNEKDNIEYVKFAYNQCPIFEKLIPFLIEHGSENILKFVKIQPGVPVKPMLAQPSKNLTSAYKRVENKEFTCEFKYDGERAQIHKFGNTYKVFSRNSEDLTEKYPDLKNVLTVIEKSNFDFILDSEVVAYSSVEKKILPFQILTTRKRKDVKLSEIKIKVCVFAFDCLFYEKSLLEEPLSKRREILLNNFNEIEDTFQFVNYLNCKSVDEIDPYFQESIKEGCEGLMIKNRDSYYKPSMRSLNWLKLKKDYLEGMSDSLDLIVLGAYYGKGKRTGNYGGFLLGCYDDENDVYEAICKIGTGFDDETLTSLYNELSQNVTEVPENYIFTENVKPDLWIKPQFIWEVKAAGFSLSPIYSAGHRFNQNKGISLRFPRFIRKREDKGIKDVTTSDQINAMFNENTKEEEESDDIFN